MRILLIEDDPTTSRSIELMLTHAKLNVYATDLGEEGIELAKLYDYNLILLDLNLPDMNGHEVLRQIRLAQIDTPVLILSGSDATEDKIKGFGFGADDYLTKPFHREELIARIHAIIRRSYGHSQSSVQTGLVELNLETKTVSVRGKEVSLTDKEYQMLELLTLQKGTTVSKEAFIRALYNGIDEPELKIIDVFILKLRKKLVNATGGNDCIRTVWGRGYTLCVPGDALEMNNGLREPDATFQQQPLVESYLMRSAVPLKPQSSSWSSYAAVPVPMMKLSASGQILDANCIAKDLLDMECEAFQDIMEVIEGPVQPIDEWLLEISKGDGTPQTRVVKVKQRAPDVYLQVSFGRIVEDGEFFILAVLMDVTQFKAVETQLVQSQKMQAIGQLAGGVAHDFNNLLTAISGHCDLLMLRHDEDDTDYGDLVQINQNSNRAAALVGQLLAFSRKQQLQPKIVDLREILADSVHLLNRLVGEKINLSLVYAPDTPHIRIDKRQLEQVLMNLVVNARDAMPSGGRICIETGRCTLTEALVMSSDVVPPEDYALLTVKDDGSGIVSDELPKIFEPFYSTRQPGEGTGLGLSTAYGIIKQSGGFIFVDSTFGKGTVFTMYFPAHQGADVEIALVRPTPKERTFEPKDKSVLFVEDEASVREFAVRALRLKGFKVYEADSAEQALEILKDEELEVDIFVSDVVMPGMDGPAWVSMALGKRPNVKVVFISGYAEDSIQDKISGSVFLPKPFSLNDLVETVKNQLS